MTPISPISGIVAEQGKGGCEYTVILGTYQSPVYWLQGPRFFEAERVAITASSAYDAKRRALDMYPELQVHRVVCPMDRD